MVIPQNLLKTGEVMKKMLFLSLLLLVGQNAYSFGYVTNIINATPFPARAYIGQVSCNGNWIDLPAYSLRSINTKLCLVNNVTGYVAQTEVGGVQIQGISKEEIRETNNKWLSKLGKAGGTWVIYGVRNAMGAIEYYVTKQGCVID